GTQPPFASTGVIKSLTPARSHILVQHDH
ncbi:hypothetical protein L195_g021430, partial [Trifolium pratense]